jgi:hypothetical protein
LSRDSDAHHETSRPAATGKKCHLASLVIGGGSSIIGSRTKPRHGSLP